MPEAPYALAFAAGTLAAINPCGFALLPGYLALFVSGDADGVAEAGGEPVAGAGTSAGVGPLRRALVATVAMTGGFVAVFGAFGLIVSPFALSVERWLPWATVFIGLVLVAVGAWLLLGREIKVRTPKMRANRDPTSSARAMAAYGVSFAIASLSCTVGPFLAVTATAFRDASLIGVLATFAAYALGMGAVVGALTLGVALSREALLLRLRRLLPQVARAGGLLLVLAGAYAAYYGWYEIRVLRGGAVTDPLVETAVRWQSAAGRWVDGLGATAIAATVAVLAAVAWLAGRSRRRMHPPAASHLSPGDREM